MKKPVRSSSRPRKAPGPQDHIVHVVDDDKAVCQALGLVLKGAGHAYRLHTSAATFLAAPPKDQTGCIVVDIDMPGMANGLAFQQRLKTFGVSLPVIVITRHADVSLAVSAFKAGAFDFVEKSLDTCKFLAAVAAALEWRDQGTEHQTVIEPIQDRLRTLSEREHDVLDGLLAGRPNKEIARGLGVSPRTIEVYRAKLMLKMQADSLPGLVRLAMMGAGELSGEGTGAAPFPPLVL